MLKKKRCLLCASSVFVTGAKDVSLCIAVLLYMPSGVTLAAHHLSLLTNANLVEMPQALCHGE